VVWDVAALAPFRVVAVAGAEVPALQSAISLVAFIAIEDGITASGAEGIFRIPRPPARMIARFLA